MVDVDKLQHDYDIIKMRLESANNEIMRLREQNDELKKKLALLVTEKEQWIVDRLRWQDIIQKNMDRANFKNDEYLKIIDELRTKIRELEG